jgi:hypothetical protein
MRALFLTTYSEDQGKEAINRAVHITLEEIQADLGIFLRRDDHTFETVLVICGWKYSIVRKQWR